MNIFQTENKNQMKRWGDWLIDFSLTIQGRNMTYTQNRPKKLLKNKNMCIIYFFIQISLSLSLSPPISYFGNVIATNQLQQFFFPPISAMPLPQIHSTNFFFLRNDMCTQFLQQILSGKLLLVVIVELKK